MDPFDISKAKFLQGLKLPAPTVFGECELSSRLAKAFLFVPSYFPGITIPASAQGKFGSGATATPFVYIPGRTRFGGWVAEDPIIDAGLDSRYLTILKSCKIHDIDFDGVLHGEVVEYCSNRDEVLEVECYDPVLPRDFEARVVDTAYNLVQSYRKHLYDNMLGNQKHYIISSVLSPLKNGGTNLIITMYFPDGKKGHRADVPFDLPCGDDSRCYVVPNPLLYRHGSDVENFDVVFTKTQGCAKHKDIVNRLGKVLRGSKNATISGYRETMRGNMIVFVRSTLQKDSPSFLQDLIPIAKAAALELGVCVKVHKKQHLNC